MVLEGELKEVEGGYLPVQAPVGSTSTPASLGPCQMQKLRLAIPYEVWEP